MTETKKWPCTYADHTAAVSSREGLVITRSGKITFNKEWTDHQKRGLVIAEAELRIPPDIAHSSNNNCSTPLTGIKLCVTAVRPQRVLHVSEQSQGNPRKVFSRPLGTGLRLFWALVCSEDPFWPHLLLFYFVSKKKQKTKKHLTIGRMNPKTTTGAFPPCGLLTERQASWYRMSYHPKHVNKERQTSGKCISMHRRVI